MTKSSKNKSSSALRPTQRETRVQHSMRVEETFTPMHHPDFLKGYQEVNSSYPEIILDMARKEQELRITTQNKIIEEEHLQRAHNRVMEKKKHGASNSGTRQGLHLGFTLILIMLGVIAYLSILGVSAWIVVMLISVMAALASIFVLRRVGYTSKQHSPHADPSQEVVLPKENVVNDNPNN